MLIETKVWCQKYLFVKKSQHFIRKRAKQLGHPLDKQTTLLYMFARIEHEVEAFAYRCVKIPVLISCPVSGPHDRVHTHPETTRKVGKTSLVRPSSIGWWTNV